MTNTEQLYEDEFPNVRENALRGKLTKLHSEIKRKVPPVKVDMSSKLNY